MAASPEVVVRRRADGSRELRVNGVFVMDDAETTSERRLAHVVLERGARDVLVGGLGLGFTTRELLADPTVRRPVVAELHSEVAAAADIPEDFRLDLVVADVRTVVGAQPDDGFDAALLDVDNGPDFLVHPQNADVYADQFVAECARVLRPGGTLAVWSMGDSPALRETLQSSLTDVRAEAVPVRLQGRMEAYWIISGRVGPAGAPAAGRSSTRR